MIKNIVKLQCKRIIANACIIAMCLSNSASAQIQDVSIDSGRDAEEILVDMPSDTIVDEKTNDEIENDSPKEVDEELLAEERICDEELLDENISDYITAESEDITNESEANNENATEESVTEENILEVNIIDENIDEDFADSIQTGENQVDEEIDANPEDSTDCEINVETMPVSRDQESADTSEVIEDGAGTVTLNIEDFKYTSPSDAAKWFNAAFEEAHKYGLKGNKVIINVPRGTYIISQTLYIHSNTTLKLDPEATIRRAEGNTQIMIVNSPDENGTYPGGYERSHDITIDGGIWDGTKNGGGTSPWCYTNALYFGHARNITIKNLKASNCSMHLIELTGCKDSLIENVDLSNYVWVNDCFTDEEQKYKEAIQLDFTTVDTSQFYQPYDRTPCDNVTIKNCVIRNYSSGFGEHTKMGDKYHTNINIINNTFKDIKHRGLTIINFKNANISGNSVTISGSADDARPVLAFNSTGTISNNTINMSKGNAIDVCGGSNMTVTGNKVAGAALSGIRVREQSKGVVSGNTVGNCQNGGIVYSDEAYGIISDNKVSNCNKYQIHTYEGAYPDITGNTLMTYDYNAITIEDCKKGMKVANNTITRANEVGIYIFGSNNVEVNSNTISNFAKYAICIRAGFNDNARCKNLQVVSNTITNGGKRGIRVSYADNTLISSNRVEGVSEIGIHVDDTCTGSRVAGNSASHGIFDKTIRSGWQKNVDGSWNYFANGYATVGWKWINGYWYYFDSKAAMVRGWRKIAGKWYYMRSSGEMMTGWIKVDGKWYYLNSDGAMAIGWKLIGGKWYYLNSGGDMAVGWKKVGGYWYYLSSSGEMLTGWIKVGGKEYYLYSDGHMAANEWIGKYHVNANGVWDKTR